MRRFTAELAPRGGMVDTPAITPAGFARYLQNAFHRGRSWVWRLGVQKLHATSYVDRLVWASARKSVGPGVPTWTLVAGTGGTSLLAPHFARLIGSALVALPYNGTADPIYSTADFWRAWRAVAPSDGQGVYYVCRRTSVAGRLYHVDLDANNVTDAGIPAPPAPSVVSSGTVGTCAAGVYPVAYRYFTARGEYSPWSPATLSGAIVVNEKRRWTIANSTHPRVIGKELAIGAVNGDVRVAYGSASLIISDNTTITYDEDVAFTAIDVEVPVDYDLVVPPDSPEDVDVWDGRLWLISNDPPLLWASDIDAAGNSVWETFNPLQSFQIPSGSGQRYTAFRAWDRSRAGVWTDASVRLVTPAAGSRYSVETLDEQHGAVGAAAVAIGAGLAVWFDGRNACASRGTPGDTQIISRGWVEAALAAIPAAYAERVIVEYAPNDGGAFHFSIPSTSSSTDPDLTLCWRPGSGEPDEWHVRKAFGGNSSPCYIGRVPAADNSGWYTVACYPGHARVYRIDSPVRRDEGPENILFECETAGVDIPAGYGSVSIARVHIGVRRRPDTGIAALATPIAAQVAIKVNGVEGASVSGTQASGDEYIHVKANNLGNPATDVSVVVRIDHPEMLEVFDIKAECVLFQRERART